MTHSLVLMLAVAAAAAVEMVEAMTIILAVAVTRGWRTSLQGGAIALLALAAIVAILGPTLLALVPLNALRILVGVLLLIMGLQWLRKAIMRSSGFRSQRDEAAIFVHEQQSLSSMLKGQGFDATGFTISFKGVFLEGFEVVMIVVSLGAPNHELGIASIGAGIAAIVVVGAGMIIAKPLTRVPENTLKMTVAVMLATFGTFWIGEGAGIAWPAADLFLLVLLGFYAAVTFGSISYLKRAKATEDERSALTGAPSIAVVEE